VLTCVTDNHSIHRIRPASSGVPTFMGAAATSLCAVGTVLSDINITRLFIMLVQASVMRTPYRTVIKEGGR
jgi:hypothetical protein